MTRPRLLVLPHAGGTPTAFGKLIRTLSPVVEVVVAELPGRGRRIDEPPCTSASELVVTVLRDLGPWIEAGPIQILGHSLGALAALDIAHELQNTAGRQPDHLYLAASPPPGRPRPALRDLDDAVLCGLLSALGTPNAVLACDELLEFALPPIRADLNLAATWPDRWVMPLGVPTTILSGQHDPQVTAEDITAWHSRFSLPPEFRQFASGHHFVLNEHAFHLFLATAVLNASQPS